MSALEASFERLRSALDAERDRAGLLARDKAAKRLGVSVRTLDALRKEGALTAVPIGRRVFYDPATIDAYIRANASRSSRRSARRGGAK